MSISKKITLKRAILSALGAVLIVYLIGLAVILVNRQQDSVSHPERPILELINDQRRAHNEPNLANNPFLDQSAATKCQNMQRAAYWAHDGGGHVWTDFFATYLLKNDPSRKHDFGENLSKNYPTHVGMVDAWMNSPEHRANILKAVYTQTGIATCSGRVGTVTVEHFAN